MSDEARILAMAQGLDRRRLIRAGILGTAGLGLASPSQVSAAFPEIGRASRGRGGAQGSGRPVQFWHVWGGDRQPLIEQVIADFEAQAPGVEVEGTLLSQEGLQEKYLTAIAGGNPPDVIMLQTRDLPNFASRGALRGVDDLLQRDEIDPYDTFYAGEVQVSIYQEKMYGLPLTPGAANYLVFWNKAHFREAGLDPERAPTTWQELNEFSAALTRGGDGDFERLGCLYVGALQPRPTWFLGWTFCNAGELYSEDGREVLFDAPRNVETLNWMVDSLDREYGGWEQVRSYLAEGGAGGEGNTAFFQGQISIHLQGVYHFLQLSVEAPDLEFGVALPPSNGDNPDATSSQYNDGNWNYVIPRDAKNVDGGWELIKYTCMGQGQADFFKAQGRPSVVPAFNEDPAYQAANPDWSVVRQMLETSREAPVTEAYPEDMTILSQYVEEALLKKRTPEEALATAREEAQRVHDDKLED